MRVPESLFSDESQSRYTEPLQAVPALRGCNLFLHKFCPSESLSHFFQLPGPQTVLTTQHRCALTALTLFGIALTHIRRYPLVSMHTTTEVDMHRENKCQTDFAERQCGSIKLEVVHVAPRPACHTRENATKEG
jgi:hypothetical protein